MWGGGGGGGGGGGVVCVYSVMCGGEGVVVNYYVCTVHPVHNYKVADNLTYLG